MQHLVTSVRHHRRPMASLVVRNFPEKLHRAVRRAAFDRDESVKALTIRALTNELRRLGIEPPEDED